MIQNMLSHTFPTTPIGFGSHFVAWGAHLLLLVATVGYSSYCTVLAWRALTLGAGLNRAPFLIGMSILPLWLGVVQTFVLLQLTPSYIGFGWYLFSLLDEIRLILFVMLTAAVLPATLALLAIWRQSRFTAMGRLDATQT